MSPLPPELSALLACPACRGALQEQEDALRCLACSRRYPVVDGVPRLLVDA